MALKATLAALSFKTIDVAKDKVANSCACAPSSGRAMPLGCSHSPTHAPAHALTRSPTR